MLFMFYLEKRRILAFNVLVILTYFSRLPDFDIYSLLDIRKRNKRSHCVRKNRNKKRKN